MVVEYQLKMSNGTSHESSPGSKAGVAESAAVAWKEWKTATDLTGLPNTGNSCYANSAIQFLLAARPFQYTYTTLNRSMLGPFNKWMVKLVQEMLSSAERVNYRTAEYFRQEAAASHREFARYGQQDAMEYFLHLLVKITEDLPSDLKDRNPCDHLRVELCEEIQRGDTKHYVRREEYVLSCPLASTGHTRREARPKDKYNLLDCINKFMKQEDVLSVESESVLKTSRIATLPEYLVIQPRIFALNRWGTPVKLSVSVDIPDELDMKKWICQEEWRNACHVEMLGRNEEITKYTLKAFVTHRGSTPRSGHYVCHVKLNNGWFACNDSSVYKDKRPPKENGYFFLYERIDIHEKHKEARGHSNQVGKGSTTTSEPCYF